MTASDPALLVLEDDRDVAEFVGELSRRAGFRVTVTVDAAQFGAALGRGGPDLILLDLQMPQVDGLQILRMLADAGVDSAVLLVTGLDKRTVAAAERYGVSRKLRMLGSLRKPFEPGELTELLLAWKARLQPLGEADLRRALDAQQLAIYYQPVVACSAAGWRVVSIEALLRWVHPERGLLPPDAFLDMAERSGLIAEVTDYVLLRGIEQLRAWRGQRLPIGLRINLAARLIADVTFPDRLLALLDQHGVDPRLLALEITEAAMLDQRADTVDILTRLRLKDVSLAIDDFGIGYSSLTQLFRMPFNEMKIDKSLVLSLPREQEAAIMVEALVELAHRLNLKVCAEGVETDDALEFLGRIGCDSIQGYLVSPPVPAVEVPAVITQWSKSRWHEAAPESVPAGC